MRQIAVGNFRLFAPLRMRGWYRPCFPPCLRANHTERGLKGTITKILRAVYNNGNVLMAVLASRLHKLLKLFEEVSSYKVAMTKMWLSIRYWIKYYPLELLMCFCSIDIDECTSNPCFNGGTCDNLINSFKCNCVPGYIGVRCETGNCWCSYCIDPPFAWLAPGVIIG